MRKIDVLFARFPGNHQEHPDSPDWVLDSVIKAKNDERIGKVHTWWKSDTPIDMVRNRAVKYAQDVGADVLFMIDNDMTPDMKSCHEKSDKPFFETAIDFLYERSAPSVIAAPYVGGGPNNNIFVFQWRNFNNQENPNFALMQYDREEAARIRGIQPAAALPTGLIAYDMRVFSRLKATDPGYFYYEMDDRRTEKNSTEDVTNTRDISLAWYDVPGAGCFCAWDCWALHNKIVPCEKPRLASPQSVGAVLRHTFELEKSERREVLMEIGGDPKEVRLVEDQNGNLLYADQKSLDLATRNVADEFSQNGAGQPEAI